MIYCESYELIVCSRPSTRKTKLKENENMKENKVLFICQAAMIAAVYVVLCLIFAPISYKEVQVRIAEALTILPLFTPAAIPGLFLGCFISNLMGGAILVDVVFGSLASLLGAIGTYMLRNKSKYVAILPPIVVNALIVPFVLKYGYGVPLPIIFMVGSVGLGQIISCGILGLLLWNVMNKYKRVIFKQV